MFARSKALVFGKEESLSLKGIAILMMLFHHCFLAGRFESFTISFWPLSEKTVTDMANVCKICVSIYAFISGFGLFHSFMHSKLSRAKWIICRYIKTFSGFWIVVIITAVITQLLNGRFVSIYFSKGILRGVVFFLTDLLGLANLMGTKTLLGTWWYMSAAFVFIILMPIIADNGGKNILYYLILSVVFIRLISGGNVNDYYQNYLSGTTPYPFLSSFMIGAVFAKYGLFEKITTLVPNAFFRFLIEIILVVFSYYLYLNTSTAYYYELKWGILPSFFIVFCVDFIVSVPGIKQILIFLGKHSLNLYLIHNFIRWVYLESFIYSKGHFCVIVLWLLLLSLAVSFVIELTKQLTGYNRLIDSVIGRICADER